MRKFFKELIFFVIISIAAIYCIVKPGNPYGHYFTLLEFPLIFAFGLFVSYLFDLFKGLNLILVKIFYLSFICLVFCYHLYLHNISTIPKILEYRNKSIEFISKKSKLSQYLIIDSKYEISKPRMAIFGCTADLYIETGFMQATHQNIVERLFGFQATDSTSIKFSREIYIADLIKNKPKYFLVPSDSVACYHNFTITGLQRIPEIYYYLNTNYKLVNKLDGFEIYKRNTF